MKAKKHLGQNFLTDKNLLSKIVSFSEITKNDVVVEVGPGKGGLTEILLQKAKKIIAVEKDDELADYLKEKFAEQIKMSKLIIFNQDILDFEPTEKKYKLVGNIPYYITGEIFRKFLENIKNQPEAISFVIQKEVAMRIVAKNKKESVLSISIKAYGDPQYQFTIKSANFTPKPKVDSALLTIKNISREKFKKYDITEKYFFEILKSGFAHKRKFLIKNLKDFKIDLNKIDNKTRAEDISIDQWFEIVCKT